MNIAELIKNTLKEAQELMTSKTVVGEPIKTDTHTVIPVSKVMFGFGGGGAEGDEKGKKENEILEVFEKGYRYKDRVIRHAKVVVNQAS